MLRALKCIFLSHSVTNSSEDRQGTESAPLPGERSLGLVWPRLRGPGSGCAFIKLFNFIQFYKVKTTFNFIKLNVVLKETVHLPNM